MSWYLFRLRFLLLQEKDQIITITLHKKLNTYKYNLLVDNMKQKTALGQEEHSYIVSLGLSLFFVDRIQVAPTSQSKCRSLAFHSTYLPSYLP